MIRLVIFDLDGTVLDTLADLAHSANHALQQLSFPTHAVDDYRQMVGNGIEKMLERALPAEERTPATVQQVKEIFLPYYDVHNAEDSCPYPGIGDLLETLQREGVRLAIASNKYQSATERLVAHYFPSISFAAVYGQRPHVPRKPDPTIVRDILLKTGIPAEDVLYVGDSATDMETAQRAKVAACAVTWGFRRREELAACNPQHIVAAAAEIATVVAEGR